MEEVMAVDLAAHVDAQGFVFNDTDCEKALFYWISAGVYKLL